MGKMKELFIEKINNDIQNYESIYNVTTLTNILCPNCFKEKLVQYSSTDFSCMKCEQEFTKVGTTVRYK
jgi:ribosomal protein L37AE/L43A